MAVAVLAALCVAALALPLPFDPLTPDPSSILQPPSITHPFGTDGNGFDIFSRTIAAAGRDLPLVIAGTFGSLLLGLPLGLIAGTKSRFSEVLLRTLDVFQSFPVIIIAIAVVAVSGNNIASVIPAILIINVPRFIRLIRTESLAIRESRYVEAARVAGASKARILYRHILPNVADITIVQTSLAAAHAMIVIAALSFVGVGITLPEPSWGGMIQDGARQIVTGHWWVSLFPGLAMFAVICCFNIAADGVQLAADRGGAG